MWAPFSDSNLTSNRGTFQAAHYTPVFSQQFLLTWITCDTQHFSSLWTPVSEALLFQGIAKGIAKLASENGKFIVKRRKSQSGLLFEEIFCFPGERGTFLLGRGLQCTRLPACHFTPILFPKNSSMSKQLRQKKVHTICQLPLGGRPMLVGGVWPAAVILWTVTHGNMSP